MATEYIVDDSVINYSLFTTKHITIDIRNSGDRYLRPDHRAGRGINNKRQAPRRESGRHC
jgi:hypothetical protein